MVATILSNWNNNQIANWLNSNTGCGINTTILGYDPFAAGIVALLETYPLLKTSLINQYSRADVIAAMVAYDITYTWQWVLAGLSPGTVMDEIFNHEPPIAYHVLIQYLWAYVDEVQTANYYYSKTQYFQHIKDEYGQYTYDVLVGKFIHLSNQFNDMFALTEWHMYGSSRLGVHKPMSPLGGGAGGGSAGRELVHIEFEGTWNQYTQSFTDTGNTITTTYQMSYDYFSLTRGEKNYEMVNHLGNVLVIISDKKLKTCAGDTVNYYMADVLQATDYSAFHATLKDRVWYADATKKYRFGGSNGQERDDEVSGEARSYSAEFWQYNPDLGRRFNVDPKPNAEHSVYSCFANNPLFFNDINGDTIQIKYGGFLGFFKKTLNYQNGQLYNRDGTTYSGKAKNWFLKATVSALNELNKTSTGKDGLRELENSKFVFSVQYGSNAFVPNSVSRAGLSRIAPEYADKAGSGGVIYFDPLSTQGGANSSGNYERPSFIGLGHELLGHGLSAKRGTANYERIQMSTNVNEHKDEIFATHMENQLRSEHGLPLRAYYGIDEGVNIFPLLQSGTSVSIYYKNYDYSIRNAMQIKYSGPNTGR